MNFDNKVSVIIPCYNENRRIIPVVKAVQKSKYVKEIIVVDDGSSSPTKKILTKLPGIKLIIHPRNLGKSAALKTGILATRGKFIAFIDSDLVNFTTSHFDSLVLPVIDGRYDITISERDKESWYTRLSHFSTAFTGERVFNKQLLLDNIEIFDHYNYVIEASMNRRFNGQYKIAKVFLPDLGQSPKYTKTGLIDGFYKDFKMLISILNFLGPIQLVKQLIFAATMVRI